jgi:ADP-dependent NAD(P)H-hydrate dehydratase / NAD(P)H-hydrate epimerase
MLEPLYTAEEMRAAEQGHDVDELMERAGHAVAEAILTRFGEARSIAAVCGGGANGGDGRIAARVLEKSGRSVTILDANAGHNRSDLGKPDLVVDALFGTGFSGRPRPAAARLIDLMNGTGVPIVSVDIPSGVDASTGEVTGTAVKAALSVTFHGPKVGLAIAPGRFHSEKFLVADIGLEPAETANGLVTQEILRQVPRRGPRDNKYTAGSVLVVGGAPGLTGAACLAAEAAFRADAGYVTVAAPREALPVIESRLLEAVKRPLDEVWEALDRAGALALGPGLGRSDDRRQLVRRLLDETDLPAVVDADGLFELEPFERKAETVLTPHSGELAGLIGETSSWVDTHRLEAVRRASGRFGCVVLLKGGDTLVATPDGRVLVRPVNIPALATAGTGDVLTGVVASFLAKGLDARLAAAAAATAHGVAASLVPEQPGLIASDVIAALPRALQR